MSYTPPKISVYQVFVRTSAAGTSRQYACVIGQHFGVHDSASSVLGTYTAASGLSSTPWPNKSLTGVVDLDSAVVSMPSALLQYYSANAAAVGASSNVIQFTSPVVTGNGYTRDSSLGSRDMQVGDYIKVTSGDDTFTGTITGFGTTPVDATTGEITADAGNVGTSEPVIAGTYTGKTATTYILTVISAGATASAVKFAVSTADGSDGYPAIGFSALNSAVPLANSGLQVKITETSFSLGDIFTFTVTPASEGAINKVYLSCTLTDIADNTAVTAIAGFNKSIVMDYGSYTLSSYGVSVNANATKYMNLLDTGYQSIPILAGDVRVGYRESLSEFVNAPAFIEPDDVVVTLGDTSLQNPLGAMAAAATKSGVGCWICAVEDDSQSSYQNALAACAGISGPYGTVIQSQESGPVQELAAYVAGCSSPDVANYRIGFYGLDDTAVEDVYTQTPAGNDITITAVGGLVTTTNGNFVSGGVHIGDILRTAYSRDMMGNPTYREYTIRSVTETTLTIDGVLNIAVGVKAAVVRNLSNASLIAAMKSRVSTTSRRMYAVYGDGVNVNGISNAPQYLQACMVAGQRAASYPQRPLTNLTHDCSAVPVRRFTAAQYNELAERGVWILASDANGAVFNRDQISTDMSTTEYSQQSYTTDLDYISLRVKAVVSPLHGCSNISPEMINQIEADQTVELDRLTSNAPTKAIGPSLISYSGLEIKQDETRRDHLYNTVNYRLPDPFRSMTITQRVI